MRLEIAALMVSSILCFMCFMLISAKENSSQTLVRIKRKPLLDDEYDYVKDFQKDYLDSQSPIRIQRNAVENSTATENNEDDIFDKLIEDKNSADENSTVEYNVANQTNISKSDTVVGKLFHNLVHQKQHNKRQKLNVWPSNERKTNDMVRCKTSIHNVECDNSDEIFDDIIQKTKVNKSATIINHSDDSKAEFEVIDNLFDKLVQKSHPQPMQHVSKRNVEKLSNNQMEKLREMFELINKRSIDDDDDVDDTPNRNDEVSGVESSYYESGSGSNEGYSTGVASGYEGDSSALFEGSTKVSSTDEEYDVFKRKRSLHEVGEDEYENIKKKNSLALSLNHAQNVSLSPASRQNPRSKILAKEGKKKPFPDIPLPFFHSLKEELPHSGDDDDDSREDLSFRKIHMGRKYDEKESLHPPFKNLRNLNGYSSPQGVGIDDDVKKSVEREGNMEKVEMVFGKGTAEKPNDEQHGLRRYRLDEYSPSAADSDIRNNTLESNLTSKEVRPNEINSDVLQKTSSKDINSNYLKNNNINNSIDLALKPSKYDLPNSYSNKNETVDVYPNNISQFRNSSISHGNTSTLNDTHIINGSSVDSKSSKVEFNKSEDSDKNCADAKGKCNQTAILQESSVNNSNTMNEEDDRTDPSSQVVMTNNSVKYSQNWKQLENEEVGDQIATIKCNESVDSKNIKDGMSEDKCNQTVKSFRKYRDDFKSTSADNINHVSNLKIEKRAIIADNDPNIDVIMGSDGIGLDEEEKESSEKVKKAENVYKFAKSVIEVVSNNTYINKKTGYNNMTGPLIGVWSGLGSSPEFVPELIKKDYKESNNERKVINHARRSEEVRNKRKLESNDQIDKDLWMKSLNNNDQVSKDFAKRSYHTIESPSIAKRSSRFQLIENAVRRRKINDDSSMDISFPTVSLSKRDTIPRDSWEGDENHERDIHHGYDIKNSDMEQSESKHIEIGSLGSMNMKPHTHLFFPKQDMFSKEDTMDEKSKMKREDTFRENSLRAHPVQDGKVVLAFDEVKELLPTKHFFSKDEYNAVLDHSNERNARTEITSRKHDVDVDKELADSMILSEDFDGAPFKSTLTAANVEYEENTSKHGEKSEGNNIISYFKGDKKLKKSQLRHHDDENKGKFNQMKYWLESDQLSAAQKESETAKKIQEVIDKLAKSDAELHKLNLNSAGWNNKNVSSQLKNDDNLKKLEEKGRDAKLKALEKELQEEHANYRKLLLQQQRQYEERLTAKAQLAKMQKEIDNLSLLHLKNASHINSLKSDGESIILKGNNKVAMAFPYNESNRQEVPVELNFLPNVPSDQTTTRKSTATYTVMKSTTYSTLKPTLATPGDTSTSMLYTQMKSSTSIVVSTTTKRPTTPYKELIPSTSTSSLRKALLSAPTVDIEMTPAITAKAILTNASAIETPVVATQPISANTSAINSTNTVQSLVGIDRNLPVGMNSYAAEFNDRKIQKGPSLDSTQTASQSLSNRSDTPIFIPNSSFPFPLEIAYIPKIIDVDSHKEKKPNTEAHEDGYIGCYIDRLIEGRDLPVRAGIPLVTPKNCRMACKTTGYKYAGLQYGYLCFCGNAYGKYDSVPDSECNTVCSGNDSFTCGGLWRNEIFDTVNIDKTYEADLSFYVTREKSEEKDVPKTFVSPILSKETVTGERKSEIPTLYDRVSDDFLYDKRVKNGEELLGEIQSYAASDLKALEDETNDAISHSQSNVIRQIQNLTDADIIKNAKVGAMGNQAEQTAIGALPVSASMLPDISEKKSSKLLDYFLPQAEKEEDKHSPELPIKIEPGTHLFRGEILLKQSWYDDLAKIESMKFKILSGNIELALKNIFNDDPSFLKAEVISLREASRRTPYKTIADFTITFYQNTSTDAVSDKIFASVQKSGRLDEMPVYPHTLKIKEYIMDSNARAYLPKAINGTVYLNTLSNKAQVLPSPPPSLPVIPNALSDIRVPSRSFVPHSSFTKDMTASLSQLPVNKAPLSPSLRTHIKPAHTNDAMLKLRDYMTMQSSNEKPKIENVNERAFIPVAPQNHRNNVPYVVRMFFWKDMLARKKREFKSEERNKDDEGVNATDVSYENQLPIIREKRSQADEWPIVYKQDSQKQRDKKLNTNLLKRVKRKFPIPDDNTDDTDTAKSFYRDLDSDYESLFSEPTDTLIHRNNTLLEKTTKYNNKTNISNELHLDNETFSSNNSKLDNRNVRSIYDNSKTLGE